jgi:integrase
MGGGAEGSNPERRLRRWRQHKFRSIPPWSANETRPDLGYIEDWWSDSDGTTKARNGQGKRYRARWVDDDGQERSASFASEKAAKAHLRTVARGEYANSGGRLTFCEFYRQWSAVQTWENGTRRSADLAAASVTFGNVALAQLRPSHLQAWVKAMKDRGLAATTIRTRVNYVRAAIRATVADRAIPFDATANITTPRTRKAEAAMTIPLPAEVGALLDKAEDRFAAFIALAAFGGLRLVEAAALQVGDIDFMRQEILVRRQVQREVGGAIEIRPPEYGSKRTVHATAGLIHLLSEHVRVHIPGEDPDRWLFPGEGEHPLHRNSVDYLWRKARAAAGVDCRLHDLRHFFASGLIAAGCDVVTVQRAMGHSSATVTLGTYGHLWPKAEDRTRTAAQAMFTESLAPAADQLRTDNA